MVVVAVVAVEGSGGSSKKDFFSYSTMSGVIINIGALPEFWKSENSICTINRKEHFWNLTSLFFPGFYSSQLGNLSAIARSAPTISGITMI